MQKWLVIVLLSVSLVTLAKKNKTSEANTGVNDYESIEIIVSDTACACFSAIDTSQIKINAQLLKIQCLNGAITKNAEAIEKTYKQDRRLDPDRMQQQGKQGELLIRVQNILSQNCTNYQLVEKQIQQSRGGSGGQMQRR